MSDFTLNLTQPLYDYLLKNSIREHPVLTQLREETHSLLEPQSRMQISPEQGQLMQLLVELTQAKKTLDIGTFTGYSALAVALGLAEDGKVMTCDINEEWTTLAKKYWEKAGVQNKIILKLGPA